MTLDFGFGILDCGFKKGCDSIWEFGLRPIGAYARRESGMRN